MRQIKDNLIKKKTATSYFMGRPTNSSFEIFDSNHQVRKLHAFPLRLGLHDIGLLFMPDRFPESRTKNAWGMGVYTSPRRQSSDIISCQNNFITSTIFFAYLPSNQSTSFALKPKPGLGEFRIGLRCLHVKQNSTDCTNWRSSPAFYIVP